MSIYDIKKNELADAFGLFKGSINAAYSIDGQMVFNKGDPEDPYLPDRLLIFEDKFNSTSLNESIWGYETGNIRNSSPYFGRKQNVTIEDGHLCITAKKETHLNKKWTSGGITSQGKIGWLYGRFEVKAKKSKVVSGSSLAFWLCGLNNYKFYRDDDDSEQGYINLDGAVHWPKCGEIDVVETPGTTKRPTANLWGYEGNSFGVAYFSKDIDVSEWHIYAMEWTPQYIEMSVDGIAYQRYTFSDFESSRIQAYKLPQYILLTYGLGGWSGTLVDETDDTKAFFDWVRVYAPVGVTSPVIETGINIPQTITVKKGNRYFINAVFTPANTSDMYRTWKSFDENVATCVNGVVTAVETGVTTVEVKTRHGLTAVCEVIVT